MPRPTRNRRLRIAVASRFAFRASSDGDTCHVVMTDNRSAPRASGKRVFVTVTVAGPRLHDDADRAVEVMIGRAGFPGRTAER
ncbi:hypothetical protein E2E30_19750 (plasmid) [Sphingomonas sp. AAP5]|uniref:hypothetical protein n=1 Tax=Sphingomonas sp. AAP5 TaxID=1523415 RepID=UPI0010572A58|nr:hypothetical protein [Sphingomonas sp. AAP5]QBM78122.1 hypothetical protein E2E30_19750 [Sphingomonas sp. AAP5]